MLTIRGGSHPIIGRLCALVLVMLLAASAQIAGAAFPLSGPSTPLSSILNPDGSVNLSAGVSGTLDVSGWKMTSAPDGSPRFVATTKSGSPPAADELVGPESDSNDIYWDDQFSGLAGTDGSINAAVVTSSGKLVVGGSFLQAGDSSAHSIAMWDGKAWSALGDGISYVNNMGRTVYALAVDGEEIYAGGDFSAAGGFPVSNIARWDGTSWHALGTGITEAPEGVMPVVNALTVLNGYVYAGGYFSVAGGVNVNSIARWDGSIWSSVGDGVVGSVSDFAAIGNDLYVGGSFSTAGGISANNIARWDGVNWHAVGSGVNGGVASLCAKGTDLYAAGSFTQAGTVSTKKVARWDGSNWQALGSGFSDEAREIAVSGDRIVVALSTGDLYVWDGSRFTTLGRIRDVFDAVGSGTGFYIVGSFASVGALCTDHVARWDGTAWTRVGGGNGMSDAVHAIAVKGNDLYVGGPFWRAGKVLANCIARWDGTNWYPLGTGLDNSVQALAIVGNDLYAGGFFRKAGGRSAYSIARWDGSNWYPLGSGVDRFVWSLAVMGNDLYVGGDFDIAGGVTAHQVAKWNGTSWSAVGNMPPSGGSMVVMDLAVMGSDLYAAQYDTIMDSPDDWLSAVYKWDGTSWSMLGDGMDGCAWALAVVNNELYVGGQFSSIGETSASNVARWNGSSWSALGSGVDGEVDALASIGNHLYVGGQFLKAGTSDVNGIACWDGSTWSPLGSGVDHDVSCLTVRGNSLFVGGYFAAAGGKVSRNIAVWQPRVNLSQNTLTSTPTPVTIGNDPYGFYKPALATSSGTGVHYGGGLPTSATLNRAAEIYCVGQRINNAFTLAPAGLQFSGTGATINVEFSEDDVASCAGMTYADFRAAKLIYPSDYPANKEAVSVEILAGQSQPAFSRYENGKRIYAITAPLTETGSAYGAVPKTLSSVRSWKGY